MAMQVFFDDIIFRLQQAGGISRIYAEVLPLLAALDGDLRLTQVSPQPSPARLPQHPALTVEHPRLPLGAARLAMRLPWPVLAELEARSVSASADAIWHSTYFYAPAGWRGPRVVLVPDLVQELFPDLFNRPWDRLVRLQKRRAILAADHLLCITHTTRDDVVRVYGVDPARITIAPLGCDRRFAAVAQRGDEGPVGAEGATDTSGTGGTRGAGPSPGGQDPALAGLPERFFLYVGSRAHYKNFLTVLQGFAAWPGHRAAAIVAVGVPFTDPEWGEIARLGLEGHIRQVDWVDDSALARLYQAADALVYPSLYEGFGLPLLEAMASGCPIIASRIPSTLEVAGDVPFYFESRDPGQLAKVFQEAWETGRDAHRIEAGRLRQETFSWEATAAAFLEAYRGLS